MRWEMAKAIVPSLITPVEVPDVHHAFVFESTGATSTHSLIFPWSRCNWALRFSLGSVAFLLSSDTRELNMTLGWMSSGTAPFWWHEPTFMAGGTNPQPSALSYPGSTPFCNWHLLPVITLFFFLSAVGFSFLSCTHSQISNESVSLFLLACPQIPFVSVSPAL